MRWGLAAVALSIVAGAVLRSRRSGAMAPVAGVLVAGAFLLGLRETGTVPSELVTGLAALTAAGLLGALLHPVAGLAVAIPAAAFTVTAGPADPGALAPLLIGGVVLGGFALIDFERRWSRAGLGPVFVALTIAGVFVTVPETQRALLLVAIALPLPLVSWPVPLATIGAVGAYPLLGAAMWATAIDGATRTSALVGAVASLGILVLEPVAHAVWGSTLLDRLRLREQRLVAVPIAAALQAAVVFVMSRVAGLQSRAETAAMIAAVAAVMTLLLLMGLSPADRRRPAASSDEPVSSGHADH